VEQDKEATVLSLEFMRLRATFEGLPAVVQRLVETMAAIQAMPESELAAHADTLNALNQQAMELAEIAKATSRMIDENLVALRSKS
jgi:hypothetical protein